MTKKGKPTSFVMSAEAQAAEKYLEKVLPGGYVRKTLINKAIIELAKEKGWEGEK